MLVLALYISAVVHDYDHRGVTNAFLIQDEDPLAVRRDGKREKDRDWLLLRGQGGG